MHNYSARKPTHECAFGNRLRRSHPFLPKVDIPGRKELPVKPADPDRVQVEQAVKQGLVQLRLRRQLIMSRPQDTQGARRRQQRHEARA